MNENSGADSSGNEINDGTNKANTTNETTAEIESGYDGRDKDDKDATDNNIPRQHDDNVSGVRSNGMFLVVLYFGVILNPFRPRIFLFII